MDFDANSLQRRGALRGIRPAVPARVRRPGCLPGAGAGRLGEHRRSWPSSTRRWTSSTRKRSLMHRNLGKLRRPDDPRPRPPEPTREEIAREYREHPIEPEAEVRELVGQCLWDIFSESHEVVAAEDGRVLDLGSFRYAGGVLADVANRQTGTTQYDYMNFYLGTSWVSRRADFTPVYRMIFGRLRRRGLDWIYHFPRRVRRRLPPAQGGPGPAERRARMVELLALRGPGQGGGTEEARPGAGRIAGIAGRRVIARRSRRR